ncbi:MAG: tRNA-dihydrouridine synthase [Candidatus Hodarchaeota archaeon]
MNLSNPSLLSAMAGITDGEFAVRVLKAGAGGVILGSFNIDQETLTAAIESRKRGRQEFCFPLNSLSQHLADEVDKIRLSHKNESIFLSFRFTAARSVSKIISELSESISPDVIIEINAHCRQLEICSVGAGQALLEREDEVRQAIGFLKEKDFMVSVKTRSLDLNCGKFAAKAADWGADYFHLDAYVPGMPGPDLSAIQTAAMVDEIAVIGNNSITDPKIAAQVLSTGAKAFSIAREAMKNPQIIGDISKTLKNDWK